MAYLNPITILALDPQQFPPGAGLPALKKEKKRLLAEFSLQETSVITLNGRELDKASVLGLFAQLEDEVLAAHHVAISRQPTLLAFLQDGSDDLYRSGAIDQSGAWPEALLTFIAPHYAASFNKILFKAYRKKDWETIRLYCQSELPLPITYRAAAFQDSFRLLHQEIKQIETMTADIAAGKIPDGRIQEVCDEMLISSLNELPEYFAGSRDRYGLALEDLAVHVHNVHRRVQLGIFICRQALKLKLGSSASERIGHVLEQLLDLAPGERILESITGSSGGSGNLKPWVVAAGVGAVVALLLLLL